jgi:hypothetical protein
MDVLDSGRMAIVGDPTGAVLGLWEPRAHIGAGRVNDRGCLCWNEGAAWRYRPLGKGLCEVAGWRDGAKIGSARVPEVTFGGTPEMN